MLCSWHQNVSALRYRREASEDIIKSAFQPLDGRFTFHAASDKGCVQTVFLLYILADIIIEIVSSIRERRKNKDFLVSIVDGVLNLLREQTQQRLQFGVVFGSDVSNHHSHKTQSFCILLQFLTPTFIVHISKVNLDLFANGEEVGVLVINVPIGSITCFVHINIGMTVLLELVNGFDSLFNQFLNSAQSQIERINRTFQSFQ